MHYENFIMSFLPSFHVVERTLRIVLRIVRTCTCSVVHYYKNLLLAFFTML